MRDFPKRTFASKLLPKQKFYEKLPVSAAIKRFFIDEIISITCRNRIDPKTMNLAAGERVSELYVIEVKLKSRSLEEQVLKLIDKGIPYHLLFLLEHDGCYQAWMGYKELNMAKSEALTVKEYFKTEWMSFEELPLAITGINMDEVYDNFILQINRKLNVPDGETLKSAIELDKDREKLKRKITRLESKLAQEKQFNLRRV